MVVGFTTAYVISAYMYVNCELESHSGDTTLCDEVCQRLTSGLWFSLDTPVSSTNKKKQHHTPNQTPPPPPPPKIK